MLELQWQNSYTQGRVQQDQCYCTVQITGINVKCSLSVIQQAYYIFHFYYTLYGGKYDCKITTHQTIFHLQCFVILNNRQYNCNIKKSFLSVPNLTNIITYGGSNI